VHKVIACDGCIRGGWKVSSNHDQCRVASTAAINDNGSTKKSTEAMLPLETAVCRKPAGRVPRGGTADARCPGPPEGRFTARPIKLRASCAIKMARYHASVAPARPGRPVRAPDQGQCGGGYLADVFVR